LSLEKLVSFATHIHGHLGPFLALGLKAGQLAVDAAGRDPLKSQAVFRMPLKRPYTCFIDGFMVCTGCTPGKLNMDLRDSGDGIEVLYRCGARSVTLRVKTAVLQGLLDRLRGGEDERALAFKVLESKPEDLFDFSASQGF